MAARTIWKGTLCFEDIAVPVKLYSAVEDRSVHFRLLHKKDHSPVKQAMVNPDTDEVVPADQTRRAWQSEEGRLVLLDDEELSQQTPEASREIEVLGFLPRSAIDHRWYSRSYYLGPDESGPDNSGLDNNAAQYFALIEALENSEREGLVRWVMRQREYVGALRLHQGYPVLVTLRHEEEVVAVEELEAPGGRKLDERELDMADQLIHTLEAPFEPQAYHDEYRQRVMEMIEAKARGEQVKVTPIKRKSASKNLTSALEASLQKERQRAG